MEKDKKFHSVLLTEEKCKGCTHCLRRCPTEAIRIKNGKSEVTPEKCIDCGECIRLCPYKATKAKYDGFETLENYKYKVAVLSSALFGQFDNLEDIDIVLTALKNCGFDDVFEVAAAAESLSEFTRHYIKKPDVKKPVISSSCPVIVRLIKSRFPSLIPNLLPVIPPTELAAKAARKRALEQNPELKSEDIGIFLISPCPALVSYARRPIGIEKSNVDEVLSISDMYFRLIDVMNKIEKPESLSNAGLIGVGWACTGGQATALFNDRYLAADGIENSIKVLDEIENDNISSLEFVELTACNGGCVGGTLTVENPYIAKARLQSLKRYLPVSQNHFIEKGAVIDDDAFEKAANELLWTKEVTYSKTSRLSSDPTEAIKKMAEIEEIYSSLPKLDCGSCGSPTCRAFAEDLVTGETKTKGCIILKRKEKDGKRE